MDFNPRQEATFANLADNYGRCLPRRMEARGYRIRIRCIASIAGPDRYRILERERTRFCRATEFHHQPRTEPLVRPVAASYRYRVGAVPFRLAGYPIMAIWRHIGCVFLVSDRYRMAVSFRGSRLQGYTRLRLCYLLLGYWDWRRDCASGPACIASERLPWLRIKGH